MSNSTKTRFVSDQFVVERADSGWTVYTITGDQVGNYTRSADALNALDELEAVGGAYQHPLAA
ncbi:MAG: hypothetical protein QOG62_918 [Thermoleophilaceae bacterium]|jgi:hypothetical protein|nr:hypothetical protein [Thermoleophilaceae bacterium]